jgi:uncharacterized protein (UPF0371 family)
MEWIITYDEQKALVNVTVEGVIVAQRTAEMAIQGIKFAREKNWNRFLIDYTRADVGDSTIDTYQFMTGLEKLGITHKDCIAIVYSRDKEEHYFAETVAVNRGWENIKYFFDMDKAIIWLLARTP